LRTSVTIAEATVHQEDMRYYVSYQVRVQFVNQDGVASCWLVTRRFSDFFNLHTKLRANFAAVVSALEFPSKSLNGLMKPRGEFMESRRAALERYLQVGGLLFCLRGLSVLLNFAMA
jgi:sorting nexin-25